MTNNDRQQSELDKVLDSILAMSDCSRPEDEEEKKKFLLEHGYLNLAKIALMYRN